MNVDYLLMEILSLSPQPWHPSPNPISWGHRSKSSYNTDSSTAKTGLCCIWCLFLNMSMDVFVRAGESMVCDVYLCCCSYLWSGVVRHSTTTWTSVTLRVFTHTRLKPNATYVFIYVLLYIYVFSYLCHWCLVHSVPETSHWFYVFLHNL